MQLNLFCKWKVMGGTALIWLIKFYLRPRFHFAAIPKFFLGIAPNLIGSYLLLFGSYWIFHKRFNFSQAGVCATLSVGFFVLLVINEYLQKIPLFGRTFDYYDILFSAMGVTAAYFIFRRMRAREYGQQERINFYHPV